MSYLYTRVALAHLLAEDRPPPDSRSHGQTVQLASYDGRLVAAARALKIPVFDL